MGGGGVMMIDCFVIHLVFMGPLPVANRAGNISLHMSYDNLSLVIMLLICQVVPRVKKIKCYLNHIYESDSQKLLRYNNLRRWWEMICLYFL